MNVGDYVRNNKGNIAKIIEVERENNWLTVRYDNIFNHATGITYNLIHFKNEEEILEYSHIKSSPNIIDLIEVGDYVNGERITNIGYNRKDEKIVYYYIPSDYGEDCFEEKDIKSIVTHEQFETMKYKVGD